MDRRVFLTTAAAGIALPALGGRALAATPLRGLPLPLPEVIDLDGGASQTIEAIKGTTQFFDGIDTATIGYSRPYLGPILRMQRGRDAKVTLGNRLDFGVTAHWHGLHVPGAMDGGPQSIVAPGALREHNLVTQQPAGTYWYHSHVHGQTGPQVYQGLAGFLLIEDPDGADSGLPRTLGVDDLPIVVQDRLFDRRGSLVYDNSGMEGMQGLRGDHILVNGALTPRAEVPAGLVRLRLLNGSNSRIYRFRFEDGRGFHQVAGDAGLLPAPVARREILLAPGERVEVVVDFANGKTVRLISSDEPVEMMGGMMGGSGGTGPDFEILSFAPQANLAAAVRTLPETFNSAPVPDFGPPVRRRSLTLNMMMGMGMMRSMFGGRTTMGINGQTYDMDRIDQKLVRGETELWQISADMMSHPFHVHGTSFQVVSMNGRAVDYAQTGLKDTVLVRGSAEILVRFDQPADAATPYMYHCHILEHEDSGMMGQFTVT